jgi:general secretion pathway protein L
MSIEQTDVRVASLSETLPQVWDCWRQHWFEIVHQLWARLLPAQCQLSTVTFGKDEIVLARHAASPIRIPLAEQFDGRPPAAILREAAADLTRVAMVIPGDEVLRAQVKLPKARTNVLRKALLFELPRLTPTSPDRLYFDFTATPDKSKPELRIDLRIVQRFAVDHAVATCRAAGPGVAELRFGADERRAHWRSFPIDRRAYFAAEWQRIRSIALSVAAILLLALLLIGIYFRSAATLSQLTSGIDTAGARATAVERLKGELRTLSADESFLASEKRKPLFVSTLAELSRVLPDDTWISHMQMTGDRLRVQGYSRSASHLIAQIAASHRFANPRFEAPLTSDVGNSQRFDLSLQVAP